MYDEDITKEEMYDMDFEDEEDFDDIELPRYLVRSIACRKRCVLQHDINIGHIRNRIYVNSTFEAISTWGSNQYPRQSVEQCTFINCKWFSAEMLEIVTANTKFINCTFHDSHIDFSLMENVTFENCNFVNSRGTYDKYESNVTMENCTFTEIYEIVDLENDEGI